MILKIFVDRNDELKFLEERYKSKRPEFLIIYGRRRVGKTELIKQFIRNKPAFYFIAKKQRLNLELKRFAQTFSRKFNIWIEPSESWEDTFEEILMKIRKKISAKFIFVIDEFSYWVERDKSILQTFQILWDEILSRFNIMLILMGSTVSLMVSDVLGYKSPLYGRRTGQWKLEPLKFYHIKEFLPNYNFEDILKVFGCTGGIPYYLIHFDNNLSLSENLKRLFFSKGGVLFEEGEILLREELREVYIYLDILRSISEGHTKRHEIANLTGVDITNISKYLNTLEQLGIIKRIFPVVGVPRKNRYAMLKISDFFFNFWLRFVYPYKEDISLDIYDFHAFEKEFSRYMGIVFEDICIDALTALMKNNKIPLKFSKIGKWWFKNIEIDIIALNPKLKTIIYGECKWKDNVNPKEVYNVLFKKKESVHVPWAPKKEYFVILAKSFSYKMKTNDVLTIDLKDLEKMLFSKS